MSDKPILINGGIHKDDRGIIRFINDFNLEDIKRFYCIQNKSEEIVRAWQAHKIECKYFFVVSGAFTVCSVKIDNWDNPSHNLVIHRFKLTEHESNILYIPAGFANGFKANQPNSKMIIYSNKTLDESENDDFRFDKNNWIDWSIL